MRVFLCLILGVSGATAQTPEAPKLPPGLYAVINTSMGTITAELYDQVVPNTVRNFVGLARGTKPWLDPKARQLVTRPLYNNITFHRVIPDFMIQTGDPTGTGAHNCGFTIPDEFVPTLKFDRPGRLAMANTGSKNSGGCQFFITEAPYPMGNNVYTIFGQVVDGQPVVSKIAHVIRDEKDKPRFPIKLMSVNVMRVVPAAEARPGTAGPAFYVNSAGDLLTSYQLVQGCTEIRSNGAKLDLAFFDRQNDLALLHSGKKVDTFATFGETADEPLAAPGGGAIKASLAIGFLEANNVSFTKTAAAGNRDASQYTIEVQCWK